LADALGAGDDIQRALGGGADAYARGRSTETSTDGQPVVYVYERWLTRPRDPSVNDR
jgi:hypothetical protein